MFSKLGKRVTYANVAMTLALVFAMSGGAYAAGKYLVTSTKQISPKVLSALKGKAGPAGAPGAQGPAGPAGPAGSAGAKGENGAAGGEGKAGANGESVAMKAEPKGAHCKEGGVNFTASGKTEYACNGKEGSPWVAGGTLPAGSTEGGEWSYINSKEMTGAEKTVPISFGIPLKTAPQAHLIGNKEELAGEPHEAEAIKKDKCKGNAEKPEAANGQLCVFTLIAGGVGAATFQDFQTGNGGTEVSGTVGTSLDLKVETFPLDAEKGEVVAGGTWAVTGD